MSLLLFSIVIIYHGVSKTWIGECFKYWFWSESQGQFFLPDCRGVTSRRCGLVVYHQQSKMFRRQGCLLGSFCYYHFKSTSEDFSQVFRIKTRLLSLSNMLLEQNHLWMDFLESQSWKASSYLEFCGKQNVRVCGLFSNLSIVYLLSHVWSLWEIKDCLPSVTGALQA